MLRALTHVLLHLLAPVAVARVLRKSRIFQASLVLLSANLIDLDHLLADPIYDPNRCSLTSHPLHGLGAALAYSALTLWPKSRLLGFGLLLHLLLDALDCALM